jgi:beta-glucosidase-like glycosyl hydrolase/CubicO group peptidase (beta-lactamase class C family)
MIGIFFQNLIPAKCWNSFHHFTNCGATANFISGNLAIVILLKTVRNMWKGRILFLSAMVGILFSASWTSVSAPLPGSSTEEQRWVDSVFNAMTESERLGQLFMIRAHSNLGADHIQSVENQIRRYNVGGLCFFQGTPDRQAELTNRYQQMAKVPLLVSIDAEWGLGMRMRETTISYPQQLTLGAIQDNRLIYDMGKEIARQLRRIGVHVNFAPVVDVNNNPRNPVINTRSFGEDRLNVSVKSYMYAQGLQDNGIMACAKHFPGHGDTDEDSHISLPVISHNRQRLDSVELFPFRVLSQHGVGSMMVAHLKVPSLDDTYNLPTTLSQKVIRHLLKEKIRFQGIVFSDALEMKGVTKNFSCGEIEIRALEAGIDILLLPEDMHTAISEVEEAIAAGRLDRREIDGRVKKILHTKYRFGLTHPELHPVDGVRDNLNSPGAIALKRKLIANAITLVANQAELIPLRQLATQKIATLSIGASAMTPFQTSMARYTRMEHFQLPKTIYSDDKNKMLESLAGKDVVIVGLHGMSKYAKDNFGLTPSTLDFVNTLRGRTRVILAVFGNPYSLRHFEECSWLVEAYDDDPLTQDLTGQAIFGGIGFKGKLPVTASERIRFNTGEVTAGTIRLGYALPEEVNMRSDALARIDSIAREAIGIRATPGCVVLVAKDGKVVYEKAFGKQTYESDARPVQVDEVYDIASITKVAATTLSLMKLHENGQLDLDKTLGDYLPELAGTNKQNLRVSEVLLHQAGLRSWIPFYESTIARGRSSVKLLPEYYHSAPSLNFSIPVAQNIFLRTDYIKEVWKSIIESEVFENKRYRYSDLGFYMLGEVVYRLSGQGLERFAERQFYRSLDLQTMTFNPWKRFDSQLIPPTEEDRYFRNQTIRSYVHDMGAAMLGGVSGHAGLFSDATDLAVVMQMLLNEGTYGGEQFLRAETVSKFTTRGAGVTRRGLGFDMKELDPRRESNLPHRASERTFGHTGFTGTCVWADPESGLIYIFLSNRTYPSMQNQKLNNADIRNRIFEAVYAAIGH